MLCSRTLSGHSAGEDKGGLDVVLARISYWGTVWLKTMPDLNSPTRYKGIKKGTLNLNLQSVQVMTPSSAVQSDHSLNP